MLERQERVALVLLLSIVMVVLAAHLILSSLGKQPFARQFMNTSYDGELVFTTGTVDRLVFTQTGGHLIVYAGDTTIFLPAQVTDGLVLQAGDTISVYGIVETYRGKKEIVVSSRQDINVTRMGQP